MSKTERSHEPSLETPVQYVKGVGPRLGALFTSREMPTVRDLLFFFPRAYEDRTKILKVSELKEGESATVPVRVMSSRKIPTRTGRTLFDVRSADESGDILNLKWFNLPRGMDQRFTPGIQIHVTGLIKMYLGKPQIIHPEITWGTASAVQNVGRIVPVYVEIESVPSRTFRRVLWEAISRYGSLLVEDLPSRFLEKYRLPRLSESVRAIHFPEGKPDENPAEETATAAGKDLAPGYQIKDLVEFNTPWHWRLIYDEFFKFEYLVLKKRLNMEREQAEKFGAQGGAAAIEDLTKSLPFQLTGDQKKSIAEILNDLSQPHPMNRLIQGDVGSGKTAVALLTAGLVLAEGGQAVLMAPTEILAEQHFKNALKLFAGKLKIALLTGKSTNAERAALLPRLASGEPILVIGTHALIEDPVIFKNLDYVLIDEQHRFGVEQRRTLRSKGVRKHDKTGRKLHPHTLVLTATPIPRTLALTAYGDLAVSNIKEMPPGRSPILTKVIYGEEKQKAYDRIREQLKSGQQVYFVYPLVNESEAEGFTQLKSAVAEAERLQTQVFPDFKVGLLHGQQKSDEKARIMEGFKSGTIHILVSTTVIEVGVDVPNATVMAVEHAERFGLSQLHQLRGRVGRGQHQSYCFLLATRKGSETTAARLDVLEQTTDGFQIAEADLEIRGPGEFLGTRQSGGLAFKLANIVRDREWLLRARDDVEELLREDPDLKNDENSSLRRYYEREGGLQFDRLKTS